MPREPTVVAQRPRRAGTTATQNRLPQEPDAFDSPRASHRSGAAFLAEDRNRLPRDAHEHEEAKRETVLFDEGRSRSARHDGGGAAAKAGASARKSADGKAHLGAVSGFKFGRTWRIAFDDDEPEVEAP